MMDSYLSLLHINQESRVRQEQERLNAGRLKSEIKITDTGYQQVACAATTTTTTTEKKIAEG